MSIWISILPKIPDYVLRKFFPRESINCNINIVAFLAKYFVSYPASRYSHIKLGEFVFVDDFSEESEYLLLVWIQVDLWLEGALHCFFK